MIVYIHGFNSSAQSYKARLLGEHLASLGRSADYVCPDLPDRPAAAMAELERVLRDCDISRTTLIGSSLGGYYATWLAERYGTRAVLVNPAVRPYELLKPYLGQQQNLYTGRRYEFTAQHLAELAALEIECVMPERYLLLVTTGDEVLDYRQAVARYRDCRQIIVPGGDHGVSNFARHVDAVLAFARV
ncbi:MAG TPA: YqiA/YcfP family alpha/beta fold hydrolase [Burkholderiales bacterium]